MQKLLTYKVVWGEGTGGRGLSGVDAKRMKRKIKYKKVETNIESMLGVSEAALR